MKCTSCWLIALLSNVESLQKVTLFMLLSADGSHHQGEDRLSLSHLLLPWCPWCSWGMSPWCPWCPWCLICSCHGVHGVLGGWVQARCSCSGRPSPPSPTCPSASQTGSYTHGRCFSSPPELSLKLKIHSTTSARRTKILWSFSSLVPRPSVASNSSSA